MYKKILAGLQEWGQYVWANNTFERVRLGELCMHTFERAFFIIIPYLKTPNTSSMSHIQMLGLDTMYIYHRVFEFLDKLKSVQTKTNLKIPAPWFAALLVKRERESLQKLRYLTGIWNSNILSGKLRVPMCTWIPMKKVAQMYLLICILKIRSNVNLEKVTQMCCARRNKYSVIYLYWSFYIFSDHAEG